MDVTIMDVTIVADDLTGACDTGALFAGRGPVSIVVAPNLPDVDLEVVTLDTETRALSDDDAAAAMRRVGAALAPRLARSALFKKIDSTFRGPVPPSCVRPFRPWAAPWCTVSSPCTASLSTARPSAAIPTTAPPLRISSRS